MTNFPLEPIPFIDFEVANICLNRISARTPGIEPVLPVLLSYLSSAADPDRSLVNFERFPENYDAELISLLVQNPRVIEILVTLFSASHFLTEILLRNPQSINIIA